MISPDLRMVYRVYIVWTAVNRTPLLPHTSREIWGVEKTTGQICFSVDTGTRQAKTAFRRRRTMMHDEWVG